MNRSVLHTLAPLFLYSSIATAQIETQRADSETLELSQLLDGAGELTALKTVIVARDGEIRAERGYRGNSTKAAYNIKSASKSIISALVGIAIDKGVLEGPDQKISPLLNNDLPANPDPLIGDITIGNLLSMQAGLERTSGSNYARWVSSRNWVRSALAQPFVDEPGGRMLYSTASTHLLSAILTRQTGRSTLELARDWLRPLDHFSIEGWQRDPQGIYLGGNQMAMSPRSLLAFGELYRNGGRTSDGKQLISPDGSRFPGKSAPIHASPATATAMAGSCARSAATTCATPGATAGKCSTSSRS